jgi:hypothetical protein
MLHQMKSFGILKQFTNRGNIYLSFKKHLEFNWIEVVNEMRPNNSLNLPRCCSRGQQWLGNQNQSRAHKNAARRLAQIR